MVDSNENYKFDLGVKGLSSSDLLLPYCTATFYTISSTI